MKIVYHGPLWRGGTALQRAEAFSEVAGVTLVPLDTMLGQREHHVDFYQRFRWRIGWPVDSLGENARLIDVVKRERPDVVFVDNSKVLTVKTLKELQSMGNPLLVYYSPDDILAQHNLKFQLRNSFRQWDIVFTTKTYNLNELLLAGVRNPILIGNSYDPEIHRGLTAEEVGPEYERFDLVFIGAFEPERSNSLLALADAGFSVLVHGSRAGALAGNWTRRQENITLRPPVFAEDYVRCVHHGKVALCFLRKINRDRITTRSMELPAMGRPMLAEKTEEHDTHFLDGVEYVGFTDDVSIVEKARGLLHDPGMRRRIAAAGQSRCRVSGYSTLHRANQMARAIEDVLALRHAGVATEKAWPL